MYIGPTYIPGMPAMSDWQSYVPTITGCGTVTANTAEWRRVGGEMEIRGTFTTGTVAASIFTLSLPLGTIAAAVSGAASGGQLVGSMVLGSSTGAAPRSVLAVPGEAVIKGAIISAGQNALAPANGNALFNSSEREGFFARVPIVGWSGTTAVQPGSRYLWAQRFAATATRVTTTPSKPGEYRARRLGTDTAPTTVPSVASGLAISSGSAIGAGAINQYDIYIGAGKVVQLAGYKTTGRSGHIVLDFFKTTTFTGISWAYDTTTGVASFYAQVSYAGDYVGVSVDQSAGYATAYFDILVADDPVAIAQAPSVHVEASSDAGQALTADVTNINFEDEQVDTHGAWSNGVFTAPVSGRYAIACCATTISTPIVLGLWKNGSLHADLGFQGSSGQRNNSSAIVTLSAGDTLSIRSRGGVTMDTVATRNWLRITRIGDA